MSCVANPDGPGFNPQEEKDNTDPNVKKSRFYEQKSGSDLMRFTNLFSSLLRNINAFIPSPINIEHTLFLLHLQLKW